MSCVRFTNEALTSRNVALFGWVILSNLTVLVKNALPNLIPVEVNIRALRGSKITHSIHSERSNGLRI